VSQCEVMYAVMPVVKPKMHLYYWNKCAAWILIHYFVLGSHM